MTKNVECPYCHTVKDRKVIEVGQCSHGKPLIMKKFECDVCDGVFWKHRTLNDFYNQAVQKLSKIGSMC